MMKRLIFIATALAVLGFATQADAMVVCAKKDPKTGMMKEGANLHLHVACQAKEVQVDPATVGIQGLGVTLAYDAIPTFAETTLSAVDINGAQVTTSVAPGASITVSLHYIIRDTGCPGCIDQIQIGFADQGVAYCPYSGVPGAAGVSGNKTFSLTAPTTPGTYYIAFDRSEAYSCLDTWWSGVPSPSQYIGAVTVK